jgi:hypothetical protein
VRHTALGVTGVPAVHWINRPTFQQVVQINNPQPAATAFGAGSIVGPNAKKIGFVIDVQAFSNGIGEGRLQLHDHGGRHKIDITQITSARGLAGANCGAVPAGGAATLEFTGVGRFNGVAGRHFRVCVQDNSRPNTALDRLHVECSDCPYSTTWPYSLEDVVTGNLEVFGLPGAPGATPSAVALEPVLGAPLTVPLQMTATVYDANGAPMANVPVQLTGVTFLPINANTNASGKATFVVLPLSAATAVASAGATQSNPVLLGP